MLKLLPKINYLFLPKFSLLAGLLVLLWGQGFAQILNAYRSNSTTMNWNTAGSWQHFNGTAWVTATDYPGQNTGAQSVTIEALRKRYDTLSFKNVHFLHLI